MRGTAHCRCGRHGLQGAGAWNRAGESAGRGIRPTGSTMSAFAHSRTSLLRMAVFGSVLSLAVLSGPAFGAGSQKASQAGSTMSTAAPSSNGGTDTDPSGSGGGAAEFQGKSTSTPDQDG